MPSVRLRSAQYLVAIVLRLIGAFHRYAQVIGLVVGEGGQFDAQFLEVQTSHFFIQVLGQEVNAERVTLRVVPQFDLGQHLVGERGTHHEAAFVATGDSGLKACSDWASFGSSPPSLV